MFKKAKFYSLLAIIVASTVLGVFTFSETSYAAPCPEDTTAGDNCATLGYANGESSDSITFGGKPYDRMTDMQYVKNAEGVTCVSGEDHFSDDQYVFLNYVPGSNEAGIIFFDQDPTGEDVSTAYFIDDVTSFDGREFCNPGASTSVPFDNGTHTAPEPEDFEDDEAAGDEEEAPSSCQIKGIGWLVCPVIMFLAEVTDASYAILDHTLLRVEPLVLPGGSEGDGIALYDTWKIMRDFANIVFIIGFLIIVFSQITSIGITNYGIKRLLPKIIIAAILVNVSFYICVIAVDLSNILGNSMRGMFDAAVTTGESGGAFSFTYTPVGDSCGDQCSPVNLTTWQELAYLVVGGVGIGAAVAVTGAALYAFLPVLLPMILGAVLAVLTIVLALTIRQALIVILVVVSPLAFVALLLPNTEDYFKRWRSLFTAMLLVYPIISIVFGASALASRILMATDDFPVQLVGAGVSVIPLFLTPIIMKASGGLLNRWVGLVNNPNKGPIDGMRKNIEGKAKRIDNRRKIEALRGGGNRFGGFRYRRAAKGAAIDANLEASAKRADTSYVADQAQNDAAFRNTLAGGTNVPFSGKTIVGASEEDMQRALASAINVEAKLEAEEVAAANAIIQNANLSLNQIQALAKGEDAKDKSGNVVISGRAGSSLQTAAIENQFKVGDVEKTDELVQMSGNMGVQQRQAIADGMVKLSSKVHYYGGGSSDQVKAGDIKSEDDLNRLVGEAIEGGKFSGESLNSADKDALTRTSEVAANGYKTTDSTGRTTTQTVSSPAKANLQAAATDGLTNPNIAQPADRIRTRVEAIRTGVAFDEKNPPKPPARPGTSSSTPAPAATPPAASPTATTASPGATTTGASSGTSAASATPTTTPASTTSPTTTAAPTLSSTPAATPTTSTTSTPPSSTPAAAPTTTTTPTATPATTPAAAPAATSTASPAPAAAPAATPAASPAPVAATPSFVGGVSADDLTAATKDIADKLASRLSNLKMSGDPQYASEIASLRDAIKGAVSHADKNARDNFLAEGGAQLLQSTSLGAPSSIIAQDIAQELNLLASERGETRAAGPPAPVQPPAMRPEDV